MVLIKKGIQYRVKPTRSLDNTERTQGYDDADPQESRELQQLAGLEDD